MFKQAIWILCQLILRLIIFIIIHIAIILIAILVCLGSHFHKVRAVTFTCRSILNALRAVFFLAHAALVDVFSAVLTKPDVLTVFTLFQFIIMIIAKRQAATFAFIAWRSEGSFHTWVKRTLPAPAAIFEQLDTLWMRAEEKLGPTRGEGFISIQAPFTARCWH